MGAIARMSTGSVPELSKPRCNDEGGWISLKLTLWIISVGKTDKIGIKAVTAVKAGCVTMTDCAP